MFGSMANTPRAIAWARNVPLTPTRHVTARLQRLVLFCLATEADPAGYVEPAAGAGAIQEGCELDERRERRVIRHLATSGLVTIYRDDRGRRNGFQLALDRPHLHAAS